MNITVGDAYISVMALNKIAELELPIIPHIKFTKNRKELADAAAEFEKRRNALAQEYGEQDKETGNWSVVGENVVPFQEKITALMESELEVDCTMISINDFAGHQGVVPGSLLAPVEWMIEL